MINDEIVTYSRKLKLTHIPSALSMSTYVEFLFENKIIVPYRDKIVLGKPFGSQTYYLLWKKMGLLKNIDNLSVGVKHNEIDFVDYGEETMGNALGVGAGIAISNKDKKVWVNISDATLQMGSTLEAIQYIGHNCIKNIFLTVDNNNYQVTGNTNNVLSVAPVINLFQDYNWHVITVDGHCKDTISKKLINLDKIEKPVLINFLTKKGNGVKYMEDNPIEWHYKTID
tara:strand:+ start:3468 stop:4148 length:681 start_codon:yes stop_codon:yes gene_type:complete